MKYLKYEYMNKLKQLGVDVKPYNRCMIYSAVGSYEYRLMFKDSVCEDDMRAFDLQEMMDLLPSELEHNNETFHIKIEKNVNNYSISYENSKTILMVHISNSLLYCAYRILVYMLENNYHKI